MPDEASRWPQGAAEIETMLERGDLQRVAPSTEHADLLMGHADEHLRAAKPLIESLPTSAFPLIYDAARKAMTAVLARQGLRPHARSEIGAHKAVQQAIQAQLGRAAAIIRPFGPMRIRRHETEYPSMRDAPITGERLGRPMRTPAGSLKRCENSSPGSGLSNRPASPPRAALRRGSAGRQDARSTT